MRKKMEITATIILLLLLPLLLLIISGAGNFFKDSAPPVCLFKRDLKFRTWSFTSAPQRLVSCRAHEAQEAQGAPTGAQLSATITESQITTAFRAALRWPPSAQTLISRNFISSPLPFFPPNSSTGLCGVATGPFRRCAATEPPGWVTGERDRRSRRGFKHVKLAKRLRLEKKKKSILQRVSMCHYRLAEVPLHGNLCSLFLC